MLIISVQDAHIYFMRHLLIDYPDALVVEILKNNVSAMGPESRLIINDMPVPDRVTAGDQQMMYLFDLMLLAMGGRERSLSEYRDIFDKVGLELVKVYKAEGSQMMMLETRLKA
jgi:O-methyltransferase domain